MMASNELPTLGRVVDDVIPPPNSKLESDKLWSGPNGGPNLEVLRDWFFREGRLDDDDITKICQMAYELIREEENVVKIDGSVTICGDIHGQYYDLLKLFELGGELESTIYLFLGDYVDRGQFGFECTMYLFCHKILYPQSFFLLRGNHECRHLTAFFNFKEECLYKYDECVYETIMDCFDCLPLSAVVNDRFFCCHGGLSPEIHHVAQINNIDRFIETPNVGAMCDLLWADPIDDEAPGAQDVEFVNNTTRGCSYFFGLAAVSKFLERNQLLSVLRAHEAQVDGYKMHCRRNSTDFPPVITLFSAPNYCDTYANKGAILKYHNSMMNIRQFNCSPHPYHLPNFMNVFEWSLPFVADKIAEFCSSILSSVSVEEDHQAKNFKFEETGTIVDAETTASNAQVIKNKIRSAAKFAVMLRSLRDHSEELLKIKKEMPDNKIPTGLLQKGTCEIKKVLESFQKAKAVDLANERMPTKEEMQSRKPRHGASASLSASLS